MTEARIGFIVYGVHKDGLQDPMGTPFVDDALIAKSKQALVAAGLRLVEYETVVATRAEAEACFAWYRKQDDIDGLVLFSGTWVWAAHLIAAVRDYAMIGKPLTVWTHPGSQGWRPVGGLVLHAALKEIGIQHRFVYGAHDDAAEIGRITSWCRAGAERNRLNMSVCGAFGGRGMGQTCGVVDPSQWMRHFGIDIDSRDTTDLLQAARAVSNDQLRQARKHIRRFFSTPIPEGETADKSIRLYVALQSVIAREGWDFYTIQSFPGLGDDYSATCFAQSMMLNDRVATSTLCDFNTALTVKLLNDLSPEPVYYGDLQHFDKVSNEIKIIGDGACPPSLAGSVGPATFAEHGIPTEGDAGGISVDLVCKPGDGVLARIGRDNGMLELVIARCSVWEPDAGQLEARRRECGIPFWPHAFVTAQCEIDDLIEAWNNEYACLGYGAHLYEELIAFAEQSDMDIIAL